MTGKLSAENGSADNRAADNDRAADNQAADNQATDNQATDNQATDNQATDNQATDNRSTESRRADNRYADWQTPDGNDPDRPTHVIAHLSDTHLTSAGVRYNGVIDSDAALDRAVAVLRDAVASGRQLDAVVLSGDLTDTGDPDAYRRLVAAVESIAPGNTGPTPIFATGNHDVRTEFHRQLLRNNDSTDPILQVHDIYGLRVIVLDSTIPGAGHGRLTVDHLAALDRELAAPAPAGTVIVLHHAPIPPPSPLLSYFALEGASRRALAQATNGTDARLILAGHHHIAQSAMLGGVPVAVAGSTAIRTDPLAPAGHDRTWASGTFNLVEVYPDTITVSVIPVDGAPQVFDLDPAGCQAIIALHPIERQPERSTHTTTVDGAGRHRTDQSSRQR